MSKGGRVFYESTNDYVRYADFSDCEISCGGEIDPDLKRYLLKKVWLNKDPDYSEDRGKTVTKDGKEYFWVNYGEDEESYLRVDPYGQNWFYLLYEYNRNTGDYTDPIFVEDEAEAESIAFGEGYELIKDID